eukprot:CAMPEP_0115854384 /NCGR_PEP_ID=MMETSP0287-20121206/13997_1 /TAXON_ID=412157 /ORGANISM="Chrysochromulina rotalis, Strain UIO044" /LENGTH=243 /DNA_ID=CAMNT_0003308501 /DNA_START=32 /DNA_END=763 /DNA_ORIENTATION=-
MSTVVEVVKAECDQITAKGVIRLQLQQLSESVNMIKMQTEAILEKRATYGDEVTHKLLNGCEANVQVLIQAEAELLAQRKALQEIPANISNDTPPQEIQRSYVDTTRTFAKEEAEQCPIANELRELRSTIAKAQSTGGAGSSGQQADDGDLGADGFAMTQETRSTKCPLLCIEMDAAGDNRPMKSTKCVHVFSFKGIENHLKRAKGTALKCPYAGCQTMVTIRDFVDDKALARDIKRQVLAQD